MASNSNGTPKWIIYVGGIASIATIIGVIIAYNNYVHPPTPIAPTPTVPFVPITLTAPLPTSTPLPSINTAQDIYTQFTDAGIAMGDEGNVPNSWWYQCCKYSPGKGSLSFIDVASGGKMVIALFSTFNAMQTDVTQMDANSNHPGSYPKGTCLLLYWSASTNLTPYEQVMQQYCV